MTSWGRESLTWGMKDPELCRRVNTPTREGRTFAYLSIIEGGTSHERIRGRAKRMPADANIRKESLFITKRRESFHLSETPIYDQIEL